LASNLLEHAMEVKSARPAPTPQPVEPSRRAEEAKQVRSTEARAQAQEPQKSVEAKPVVNTQGQQTGRLLNVTA
jgi:hypothetical protein